LPVLDGRALGLDETAEVKEEEEQQHEANVAVPIQ
jgi:hypothetical protein